MNDVGAKIGAGIAAIIGLAVLAIVISQQANTTNVLSAFFGGLSNLIGVAISPVTGQQVSGLSAAGMTGGSWVNGSNNSTSMISNLLSGTGFLSNVAGALGGSSGGSSGGISSSGFLSSEAGALGGSGGADELATLAV